MAHTPVWLKVNVRLKDVELTFCPATQFGTPKGEVTSTVSPFWKPLPLTVIVCAELECVGVVGSMEPIAGGCPLLDVVKLRVDP
jgi:hypothetical protein